MKIATGRLLSIAEAERGETISSEEVLRSLPVAAAE